MGAPRQPARFPSS